MMEQDDSTAARAHFERTHAEGTWRRELDRTRNELAQALARNLTLAERNRELAAALRQLLTSTGHTGRVTTCDVGRCETCHKSTSSGMIHTCSRCAAKRAREVLGEQDDA